MVNPPAGFDYVSEVRGQVDNKILCAKTEFGAILWYIGNFPIKYLFCQVSGNPCLSHFYVQFWCVCAIYMQYV